VAHASVHELSLGYSWAAGIFIVAVVVCSQIVIGQNILAATTDEVEEAIPVI
jgi:hypothetical protein